MRPTVAVHLLFICESLGAVLTLDVAHSMRNFVVRRDDSALNALVESMSSYDGDGDSGVSDNDVWDNPDIDLSTPEMIRRAGYPAETHVVQTEDGYLLTLHRIPGGPDSPPVFLQHGIISSSADWVIMGKDKSLAYILADQGYDVWMGNYRGNTYSRAHISLSPSDLRFWNFSFHEMGMYDIPSMLLYITNMRSRPLHTYIGHSMGSTGFYIMASEKPEMQRMVQRMISFAPGAFMGNIKGLLRMVALLIYNLKLIPLLLSFGEILPQSALLRLATKYSCNMNLSKETICSNIIFMMFGYDQEQFNYTMLPVYLNHDPAGSSAKTVVHFGQEIFSNRFRRYDYGREKNLLIYNSTVPPDYNLANITVPIAVMYGDNDLLTVPVDIKRFYNSLTNVLGLYRVPWHKFNHVDFLWAKDASKLVYKKVLEIMRKSPK